MMSIAPQFAYEHPSTFRRQCLWLLTRWEFFWLSHVVLLRFCSTTQALLDRTPRLAVAAALSAFKVSWSEAEIRTPGCSTGKDSRLITVWASDGSEIHISRYIYVYKNTHTHTHVHSHDPYIEIHVCLQKLEHTHTHTHVHSHDPYIEIHICLQKHTHTQKYPENVWLFIFFLGCRDPI